MCRGVGNILEGDLTLNILPSKDCLLRPLHEDPDIGQWRRHSDNTEVAAPSSRRRSILPVMDAAKIKLVCASFAA